MRPLEGVPATGPVRIFLDDERPAPAGWTLAKYGGDLLRIVDRIPERISEISFDQNLIPGDPKGREIADYLWSEIAAGEISMPNLKRVGFHTDDPSASSDMASDLRMRMADPGFPRVETVIGMPVPDETVEDIQSRDRMRRETIPARISVMDAAHLDGADRQAVVRTLTDRSSKGPTDATPVAGPSGRER